MVVEPTRSPPMPATTTIGSTSLTRRSKQHRTAATNAHSEVWPHATHNCDVESGNLLAVTPEQTADHTRNPAT